MQDKYIVLDRDGVINVDLFDYVLENKTFEFEKGSIEAIAKLTKKKFKIIIATNQTCINLGLISAKGIKDINDFSKNANTEQKIEIFASFEILIDKFKLNKDGCRILTNFGTNGRQEVPHLNFHIVGGKDVGRMFN